jgi:dUTP pyrophosphatase
MYFNKRLQGAVTPAKQHKKDAGFDLTIIKLLKVDEYGTEWYDSGIAVQTPPGYYFDLVGRSSLIKKGRQLANCVGIIDENYRGNIVVALTKLSPDAPTLDLPNRACQLILRKWYDIPMIERDILDETNRGNSGFGSTGM